MSQMWEVDRELLEAAALAMGTPPGADTVAAALRWAVETGPETPDGPWRARLAGEARLRALTDV
ncbi:hypothetical protein Afil01_21110 [Actinorhabdospora filicis]|uniref:DUF2191 domain-containing protein n=1 Tax=Actinorhabdospora filicis TaxID=1785913 RepID=A0A9W6SKG1_9ACTN|nr:hypothetical protein [Actinorhabdospora filicis]GLZ77304.1 hypothetical protein Afil01_21110 [Actinorhabdospora filicis]